MNSLDFFNSSVKNMEEKRAIPEDTYFFILDFRVLHSSGALNFCIELFSSPKGVITDFLPLLKPL